MSVTPINDAARAFLENDANPGEPGDEIVTAADHPTLARLVNKHLHGERISAAEYAQASEELGCSKRHIQRQLAVLRAGRAVPKRARFELSSFHKQVIISVKGNVRLAYRRLEAAGEELPDPDTFWRRWHEQPTGIQRYARHGAEGLVDFWLYPPWEAPERNTVWQADHFELPVDVIADGHRTTLVKPWLTLFEDDKTRMPMAWSLLATPGREPGADEVCATIAEAIRLRLHDSAEIGGVPGIIRWDQALSFTAGMVTQLGTQVGFECHAVPPYSGWMKGKVERLGKTVEDEFCVEQPGFTHGPKTRHNRDPLRTDTGNLTAGQLRARLDHWMAAYAFERVHSALGCTPFEAWAADATPLRRTTDVKLRSALMVWPRQAKVHKKKGVFFRNQYWMGAGLLDIVGRSVEVHYPVNDSSFIEVYRDGHWVCTAWPAKSLTPAQSKAVWDGRADMYSEIRALHEGAARLRRGANAVVGSTDATPSAASMPAEDPIAASAEDLFDLLAGDDTTDEPMSSPGA